MQNPSVREIFEKVKESAEWETRNDYSDIKNTSTIREDMGVSSVDHYCIAWDQERNFNIRLNAEVIGKMQTLGDIVEIVAQKLGITMTADERAQFGNPDSPLAPSPKIDEPLSLDARAAGQHGVK